MKQHILILIFTIALFSANAQAKRALIVGIGNYSEESGWKKIHGDNDIPIIQEALIEKGFINKNILCLANERATKSNIVDGLNQLINQASLNDFIYIHFSTHGQQVFDVDGDEQDSLDEAVIPFDAFKHFEKGKYEGEKHLIDDELNRYLSMIRGKIGQQGNLLVVIDACHSGDATRGENDMDSMMIRGTSEIFEMEKKQNNSFSDIGPLEWVVISATQSYQNNYEYYLNGKYYGSLSYAVNLTLKDLSGDEDFTELFNLISEKRKSMNVARYPQRPMIEGENHYKTQKVF